MTIKIIICDAPRPVSVASKGLQVVPTKNLMILVVSVAGKGNTPNQNHDDDDDDDDDDDHHH